MAGQAEALEVIRDIIKGTHDVSLAELEEKEGKKKKQEAEAEKQEGDLPDLFSLRRTPFYQKKVE